MRITAFLLCFATLAFVSVGCQTQKLAKKKKAQIEDYYSDGECFVQLTDMGYKDQLIADFADYDLKVDKEVSANMKMIMISWNPESIALHKMMALLELKDYVASADFAKEAGGK